METLDQRREKGNLNFAKKCLKIENMKLLFPLNEKKHDMKNRKKSNTRCLKQIQKDTRNLQLYQCKSC